MVAQLLLNSEPLCLVIYMILFATLFYIPQITKASTLPFCAAQVEMIRFKCNILNHKEALRMALCVR
jgi:hypothetical protein